MSAAEIRCGVVGVGHLGRLHARILSGLPGAVLAGVMDAVPERAEAVAREYRCTACPTLESLLDRDIRFAVVATPTEHHYEIGRALLAAGVATLIEKPFTRTIAEADALLEIARASTGGFVGVGHVERFNPVVQAARRHVKNPLFIECDRVHPFSFRSMDVGVVLDLMIHDLDLVHWLAGGRMTEMEAVGASVLSGSEDMAFARLRFANGCTALLRASRVSLRKVRKLRIFCEDLYVSLDYLARTGMKIRVKDGAPARLAALAAEGPPSLPFADFLDIEDLAVEEAEPLRAELDAFVAAVRNGAPPPVGGDVGREALACALRIGEAIQRHQSSVREMRGGLTTQPPE